MALIRCLFSLALIVTAAAATARAQDSITGTYDVAGADSFNDAYAGLGRIRADGSDLVLEVMVAGGDPRPTVRARAAGSSRWLFRDGASAGIAGSLGGASAPSASVTEVEVTRAGTGLDVVRRVGGRVARERWSVRAASLAVVASRRDEAYVTATYRLPPEKLRVIGNYVDVSVFKPDPSAVRHDDRMVFVGRLAPQKNFGNLIRSLGGLPYGLDIYGHDDSLKGGLQALAEQVGARVTFHPAVPNRKLGAVLNSYSLFVLPSLYEGMPKVLLEAMACGLAVLGTNVEGINEVIRHQTSGFLVQGTDPASLREGILALAPNRSLQKTLGAEAARHVRENYSLEAIFEKEAAVIKALS